MIFTRNLIAAAAFFAVLAFASCSAPEADAIALHQGKVSLPTGLVICEVFEDRYCGQALRVAWCESRLNTEARNGQYRGLFQMGAWERRRYGHGSTAREQARAARRYFIASGRDWSPWECKP